MSIILDRSARLREKMTLENLYEIICQDQDRAAARYLEGEEERVITYEEYDRRVRSCAWQLKTELKDRQPGSFIGIQLDTCPDWFTLFWGVIAAGFNAVLVDFTLHDDMTAYILEQAGAVALIAEKTPKLSETVRLFSAKELAHAAPAPRDFRPAFGHKVALCTSGTTETSRVFVYDEQAVCSQVLNSELIYRNNKRIIADEPGRNLAFLPFHHVFGFMVCLLWIHFLGYENIYLKDRSPQTILETARRFRVTHLIAVPLLANHLAAGLKKQVAKEPALKRAVFRAGKGLSLAMQAIVPGPGLDFARRVLFKKVVARLLGPDISCVILGGAHTPKDQMRTLSALGYYTVAGFGMTETGVTSVELSLNLFTRTSGSVGRPLDSAQYRVQPDGKAPNRGEMFIRGDTVHTGRLADGKLLPPALDQDGWYPTGDVVRLEKGNRMYVEGRAKDLIINESGENVYPDEIEEVFSALEGPEQICVLGIWNDKTHEKGHMPHLPGHKKENVRYEDITLALNLGSRWQEEEYVAGVLAQARRLNAALPPIKRVTRVAISPEKFAVTSTMKVKRLALKKQLEEGRLRCRMMQLNESGERPAPRKNAPAPAAPASREEDQLASIRQKVRQVYAEALDIPAEQVRDDAHFIDDLGGDSLQVLGMSLKIEEMFDVMIPTEEYGQCTTVNGLTRLLADRLNGVSTRPGQQGPVTPITRFEDAPEFKDFEKRREALMHDGQENPYFVCHDSPLLDTSNMAGKRVLNFGSYNYVGMSGRPEVREAAKRAIDQYGTSASGSRLLAGEKSLHGELEREIADWKHAEDALVLVGGHSTNVTCVGNFCGKGDLILYDAIAHNSIEQGCRLSQALAKPFPHNDTAALESILRTQRSRFAKVLIVIEGAYSMDGDIAPVPEFVRIKKQYGCFLMVDEAHSACVIGKTGGGVDEYFGLQPNDIDIKMGTLSKGLGACGGYLAGSRNIIEYMRYSLPGFVFSVGISPPLAAAALTSIRLLRSDPSIMERMARNIRCFVEEAHKRGFNTCLAKETAIVPVLVGSDENAFLLSNKMREKGVFVPPAVFPAVPKNKARLRFCVISEHKPEQIVEALDKLQECVQEAGISLPQ